MKRVLTILVLILLCTGLAIATGQREKAGSRAEKEQYYWIASISTLPLFLFHDYPTLKQKAESWGAEVVYPQNFDDPVKLKHLLHNYLLEISAVNINVEEEKNGDFALFLTQIKRLEEKRLNI